MVLLDDYMRDVYQEVFERMRMAGWLSGFAYTKDEVAHWRLNWTDKGVRLAGELTELCDRFGLLEDSSKQAILAFRLRAEIGILPGLSREASTPVILYWRHCITVLGLGEDADGIVVALYIIEMWYRHDRVRHP
jgi:hypothetical protein